MKLLAWLTMANVLHIAESSSNTTEPFFEFSSGNMAYDRAYRLAMREVTNNIENGVFIAGAGWKQLWTRDTSYAVELGAGLLHPDMSKASLRKSTEQDRRLGLVWLQDSCGHFGGWPYLSDAIVGVRGAWSVYLTSGDRDWLAWSYNVTRRSLLRAERDVFDNSTGLFLGCSSFMESNSGYPQKYRENGKLVGATKALSTNMLHFAGYKLGSKMALELQRPQDEVDELNARATALRDKIRSRLWMEEKGYYSYVEDEHNRLLPQMEGLGESLVLLDEFEPDSERVERIFSSTHRTKRGLPCLWPQFNNSVNSIFDYYHNGRIWPFVQGYWGLAAARHRQLNVFEEELANMVWLSEQGKTFAEFYELNGEFPRSRERQLWSDTGFISMIYHGLFGMTFHADGIEFAPLKPTSVGLSDSISLIGIIYRQMTLDIHVQGAGAHVQSVVIDGRKETNPFIKGDQTGPHTVFITMSEQAPIDIVTDMANKLAEGASEAYDMMPNVGDVADKLVEDASEAYAVVTNATSKLIGAVPNAADLARQIFDVDVIEASRFPTGFYSAYSVAMLGIVAFFCVRLFRGRWS